MSIFDRYLLASLIKILMICTASLVGLYVIIDVFANLDEVINQSQSRGGFGVILASYYGPRSLEFLDRLAPVIVLIAAVAAVGMAERRNEIAALSASGISRRRILRPVFVLLAVVILGSIANREILLPQHRLALARSLQSWSSEHGQPLRYHVDHDTGVVLRGSQVFLEQDRITLPELQFPPPWDEALARVSAESADYLPATSTRSAGLWLRQVVRPARLADVPSLEHNGQPLLLTPHDYDWLATDECFWVTTTTLEQLALAHEMNRYASLPEMIANMHSTSARLGNIGRVELHQRVMRPLLDLTLVLIGLSVALARTARNVFVAAGICLLTIAGVYLLAAVCQGLGASGALRPPALAAWLPLIVLFPAAICGLKQMRS